MHTLIQDFRYALRQLRQNLGFSLTAILSLALGIGATVSVFSVIYGVLVNPYPYADTERMAHLVVVDKAGNHHYVELTGTQLRDVEQLPAIQSLLAMDEWNLTITGHDFPEDVTAIYFTANSFPTFGVPPLLGRNLAPSDSPFGQEPQPVVMLSHRLWLRHFNGDPNVIGQTLELVHKPYKIVGVVGPRFTWGDGDVYLPQKLTNDQVLTFGCTLRLKPGVSRAIANAQLQPLLEQFARQTPNHFPKQFKVQVQGLNDQFVRDLGGTLYLLLAAVALLLAIGCGNVSILLLARGTARQHEFAVRSAIGANRLRLIRQLLTEALMLSLSGASFGVLLAYRILGLIVSWLPKYSFPHEADIRINLPVLLFSVGLAVLTGILFGLFPALQLARPNISQVMQTGTRKLAGSARGKRTHGWLITGQIALTLLLLVAASSVIEGFTRLMKVPLGYDPKHVMSVGIPVHDHTFTDWAERMNYFEQLREKVAAMPEVVSAGLSTNATPPDNGWEQTIDLLGKPTPEDQRARINFVSPEYFQTLHIPLKQGRLWDRTEDMHGAPLAAVNETFGKRYFDGDVLGHSLRVPRLKSEPPYNLAAPGSDGWLQIVGIVGDALDDGLDKPEKPEAYVPYSLFMPMHTQILVRSHDNPLALLHDIRLQIAMVNPDQQAGGEVNDLETWIEQEPEWARGRLISVLFAAFSGLALALAAVGLYSVISYTVVQRTNEFGIRMALGAKRVHVLKLVFLSAVVSVGTGLALGLLLSVGMHKLVNRWAAGAEAFSPVMLVLVTAGLLLVAAVACLVPARRASAVEPMAALRYE